MDGDDERVRGRSASPTEYLMNCISYYLKVRAQAGEVDLKSVKVVIPQTEHKTSSLLFFFSNTFNFILELFWGKTIQDTGGAL